MEVDLVNDLDGYALESERLSANLRGERVALLDWLEGRDGAPEDLSAADAAVMATLVKARMDTLSELTRIDDVMLFRLLQRASLLGREEREDATGR